MRLLLALVIQSDPTITQAPDGWTMLEDADPQEFVLNDDSDYDVHIREILNRIGIRQIPNNSAARPV